MYLLNTRIWVNKTDCTCSRTSVASQGKFLTAFLVGKSKTALSRLPSSTILTAVLRPDRWTPPDCVSRMWLAFTLLVSTWKDYVEWIHLCCNLQGMGLWNVKYASFVTCNWTHVLKFNCISLGCQLPCTYDDSQN